MKITFKIALVGLFLLTALQSQAQTLTQTIKGVILDKDSEMPLIGANVIVSSTDEMVGTSADENGEFKLENIPIGRHTIEITYIGYEPTILSSLLVTSGKELFLNIELAESVLELAEAVVVAKHDKTKALNEMATVSSRSFSVEETSRYASSLFDPARMAQNYAGVTVGGGSSDLFNEIIVRGNSPRGVLWRLEGIEIPNPNHFGAAGNSGGGISMLSSSILSNSDFYTGAFPAEFGNAISGVFDLNMRNGNKEKREYSFMVGVLGLEAALEGPFGKNSQASYLLNYRYSTLAALANVGLNPAGDVLPEYQDVSFKVNLPTKNAGTFALFGLGGSNVASIVPEPDSTKWEDEDGKYGFTEKQKVGTLGLSHRLVLSESSYLRTVVAASYDGYEDDEYLYEAENNYKKNIYLLSKFDYKILRATSTYTNKLDARNTIRFGGIVTHHDFDFNIRAKDDEADDFLNTYLNNQGQTQLFQAYGHWKHRFNEDWTLNSGMHYTHFALNNSFSIEPRAAIKWQATPKSSLSAAVGLHSKPEHVTFYFVEKTEEGKPRTAPNKDLDLTKSLHAVIGYDQKLGDHLRMKIEAYYQHLYDVPVLEEEGSTGSIVNTQDIWDILGDNKKAVNDGTARNYGVDLTFEKFFSNNYYFLMTGSLFESKYTPQNGVEYNTRYATNYQTNILGGKEWKVGKNKNKILGVNGKFILAGGNRMTPIDIPASQLEGEVVWKEDQIFSEHAPTYWRLDVGVSYKINRKRTTHTIMLDVQNVTNHLNVDFQWYDVDDNEMKTFYQTGLFPTFNYRIEF